MTQGVLEEILAEMKRLNRNLETTNVELATVPTVNVKPKSISEQPQTSEVKSEPKKVEQVEETQEESKFTIDDVKRHAKEFLQKGDASDKKALKDKLTELGAGKVSDLKPTQYEEVIEFFMDRLS
ncbi:hypothetical protein [Staphylococcus pseudintermedius]|uniref:hypothetical protein n=1 Tax=Staphylococcus pseudintermedius TaxID=283734 RepID=UPI0029286686|nr:hypothetical protein [Staphylococcus pseudintermedius]MDU9297362.1 hypothetical protein [Staphylococcus pseudintermedius]MDU9298938.1 hypothetical protein [Staphylococcus pseudintermedius]MDU9301623.1 hypothetical protein [Staphylococcus pseudintermedius]